MALPPAVQVSGVKELRAALRHADGQLKGELRRANKSGAQVVVEKALPHVPVGATSRLKNSVRALGSQSAGRAVAGSSVVNYAAAIHWGRGAGNVNFRHGRKAGRQRGGPIKGRPFLWDAAQKYKAEVVAVYERAMVHLFDQIRTRG